MKGTKLFFATLVTLMVLVFALTACGPAAQEVQLQGNVIQAPDKGQMVDASMKVSSVKASTPVPGATAVVATPTPIPTAQTQYDEQFAMLDAAVVIPAGNRDATVKYLSPMNGQMYFIQKYYYTSGGVGFAIYRGASVWVKAPIGTPNAQGTPAPAMEYVVVPTGEDIGISQFFYEAVPVTWAHSSDFTTSITLENNTWYK